MEMNEFDKWLKHKIESEELDYKPKDWDSIKNAIHTKDNNKKPIPVGFGLPLHVLFNKYVGIAAALIVLFGVGVLINQNNSADISSPINDIATITQEPLKGNSKSDELEQHKESTKNTPIVLAQSNSNNNSLHSKTLKFDRTSTLKTLHSTNSKHFISDDKIENGQPQLTKEVKQENLKSNITDNATIDIRYNNLEKSVKKDAGLDYYVNSESKNSTIINNIGIGGGVNYGNFNTGYAVALSAQKDIARNVFIEGTIGMNINNSNQPIVGMNNSGNVLSRPAPGKTFVNSPAITNNTPQLLYVQFNPSVGYNFEDILSFSVGSDLQQIINNKDDKIVTYNAKSNQSEILPNLDLGITTKTEISLSKNIKTGLILRNGLNNVFNTQNDVKYVNRRYIQVQFRYLINFKKKNSSSRF